VPALVLEDGGALIESTANPGLLDEVVPGRKAMIPAHGPSADMCMKLARWHRAWRQGGEFLVSSACSEEINRRSGFRVERRRSEACGSAGEGTRWLASPYWLGEAIGHADIAVAAC